MYGTPPLDYLRLPYWERSVLNRTLSRAEELRVEREKAIIKANGISVGNNVGRVMGRIMSKIFGGR